MSIESLADGLKEMIKPAVENFKNIMPENTFSPKEIADFWKSEFHNLAEQAKSEDTAPVENTSIKECYDDKRIPCRNEDLAGKEHLETQVTFEQKTVVIDGVEKEVVVPVFDSAFDAKLPEDKFKSSDAVQFKECNAQLKESLENDPELQAKFDNEQLEQIESGDTPDGYTWHHDAEAGKMQLVDSDIHQKTGHTGGRSIWGGGSDNR